MKSKLFLLVLLCFNLTFGQNQSLLNVSGLLVPLAPNEIFRFQPGNVTQLDGGVGFGVASSNRWFSIGKVQTGTNLAYGLRFQAGAKALTFGFQDVNNANPRIQWIGTGADLGNLDFRVADSFTSTNSNLVATMTKEGSTVFGSSAPTSNLAKVSIVNSASTAVEGLNIETSAAFRTSTGARISANTSFRSFGLIVNATASNTSVGILSTAGADNQNSAIGVRGVVAGTNTFQAGIYGESAPTSSSLNWAGYFDGNVLVTGFLTVFANWRMANNVIPQVKVLDKIMELNPISYQYNRTSELNLPAGIQHGFIPEELAKVYPELTSTTKKPVFNKEGDVTSFTDITAVNYNGMIPILTAALKELHQEVKILQEELAILRGDKSVQKVGVNTQTNGVFMNQNIPNPFTDQTTINYQLPEGTTTADLMVFDLNGTLIKAYPINKNQSEISIKAADIGSGLFIYSLVQNGQELVTKKMIVR